MSIRASSKHQYDISDFKVDCRVEYNVIRFDGAPNAKIGKVINNKGSSIDIQWNGEESPQNWITY